MEKLHKEVCKGKGIPFDYYDDYMAYVEEIAPPMESFKKVPLGKTNDPLDSGLLNELGAPAGVKYSKIPNWWTSK
jgi:hypothetical protein